MLLLQKKVKYYPIAAMNATCPFFSFTPKKMAILNYKSMNSFYYNNIQLFHTFKVEIACYSYGSKYPHAMELQCTYN